MKKRGLILFLWLFAGTYTYGQYMPQIKGVSLGDTMEKVVDRLKNIVRGRTKTPKGIKEMKRL